MDPLSLISMIVAAWGVASPVVKNVLTDAEGIGADVAAHKSVLATFEDALKGLEGVFMTNPVPVAPKTA
jgi:hypothetical protein